MRIINDSDTREYIDEAGDKIVLLVAPRQRDVERSDDIERDEAIAALDGIKALGIDTDKLIADAQAEPEKLAAAQESSRSQVGVKTREYRLQALAMMLVVGTDVHGGEAIIGAYHKMDPKSAAWIDSKVAEVWTSALPSGEEAKPLGA